LISANPTFAFNVTKDETYIARFKKKPDKPFPIYNVLVTVNPANSGIVSGAGSYDSNSVATLTATANSGYWTSNGTVLFTSSILNITVIRDTVLVVNFEESDEPVEEFTVQIGSINPSEAGIVSGYGKYEKNTTVTLTAIANTDFEFKNWSTTDGIIISDKNTFTFILTQDTVLVANFGLSLIIENTLIYSIYILPNPVHQNAIIEINCLETQPNTVITILDILGSEIITVYTGLLDEGINNFPLPNGLPSGSYILLVKNSSGQKTEQFIIAK